MEFKQFDTDKLMYVATRPPLVFTEGSGGFLTHHNSKRYLDFVQSWAVNALGPSPHGIQDALTPQGPGFPKAELNDLDSVKALINSRTVGIMLEPVQGEAGVIPATREFMQALRELTKEQGLLLIVDEVQSGFGRTGELFAYQLSGIEPDIMTLGKGIGGGVPLAALLTREEFACFEAGDQGGTYN